METRKECTGAGVHSGQGNNTIRMLWMLRNHQLTHVHLHHVSTDQINLPKNGAHMWKLKQIHSIAFSQPWFRRKRSKSRSFTDCNWQRTKIVMLLFVVVHLQLCRIFAVENVIKCSYSLDANAFDTQHKSEFIDISDKILQPSKMLAVKFMLMPLLPKWLADLIPIP